MNSKPPAALASPRQPMTRITAIELSLRAFVWGLLSIVPIIGLLPAALAMTCWVRIRLDYRNEWNPAYNYLNWGTTLAVLGIGITAIGVPAFALSVGIYNAEHGM